MVEKKERPEGERARNDLGLKPPADREDEGTVMDPEVNLRDRTDARRFESTEEEE